MKTIYGFLVLVGLIVAVGACSEDTLEAGFEYTGPIPEIKDGPAEAQKICYELYQKYDLQVYYTLGGDEALRLETGWAQTNMMNYYPEYGDTIEAGMKPLPLFEVLQKFRPVTRKVGKIFRKAECSGKREF
ncbi:MAG: hypothetical protein ACLUDU_13330 [Butyricimonas faecihominis]